MDSRTRDYIDRGRHSVPGWFARLDAFLFAAIDDAQRLAGLRGDLMEIGAYMGRSAILLGYLQREDERLVVCDLFGGERVNDENEAEHQRFYGDLTRHAFEENFRRFHSRLPEKVVSGPSADLAGEVAGCRKSFRLIHVDGSHEYSVVRSDVLMSRELLAEGGMVIFDDINSPHTPGVSAAVWSSVVNEGLVPQVVTTKLYASWGPVAPIDLSPLSRDWTWEPHRVADSQVLHLREIGSARQRVRDWIPPVLIPAATSLNQRILELKRSVRGS